MVYDTVCTARPRSRLPTNHVWAVVLVIALALLALQARPDLSSNTDTVSDLDAGHLVADLDSMANDLMANADRKRNFTPTTGDGMNIRAADTAALDLDVDVVWAELLGFELWLLSVLKSTGRTAMCGQANKPLAF
jgi:hypothetical protein